MASSLELGVCRKAGQEALGATRAVTVAQVARKSFQAPPIVLHTALCRAARAADRAWLAVVVCVGVGQRRHWHHTHAQRGC